MNSLRKFRQLPTQERWLLAQALVLLPLTVAAVRAFGIRRWLRVLAKLTRFKKTSYPADQASRQSARAIARTVRIAAQHGFYHSSCLPQSLVLWLLLRSNGMESEIRFGARKEERELEGHAWVECFGVALNEDGDVNQRFSRFEGLTFPRRTEV